MLFS
ncbi:hypothetical protein VTH06DRAFT_1211 [Thermothelomyces fergusii]|jgi:hypothetical protein